MTQEEMILAMKNTDSTFRNISSKKAPVTRQFYQ